MQQQIRYTQVHIQYQIQLQEATFYKTQVFYAFLEEYKTFTKQVQPGCTNNLCSKPEKTKDDLSIFKGSAGYLYLYLRMYDFMNSITQDELNFYQERALNHIPDEQLNLFFNPQTYLENAIKQFHSMEQMALLIQDRDITFCFSHLSLWMMGVKLAYIKKDQEKFKQYLKRILQEQEKIIQNPNNYEYEVLYGIPGYLYILLDLQSKYAKDEIEPNYKLDLSDHIFQLCILILKQGLTDYGNDTLVQLLRQKVNLNNIRLTYKFGKRQYLGGAHGLLGVIQMLLISYELCQSYFEQDNNNFNSNKAMTQIMLRAIKDSLDFIVNLFEAKGNVPTSLEKIDNVDLYQFCHGITGAISPLLKASNILKIEKYFQVCQQMAEQIWKYGMLRKGYGICHGIPGNAYTFMQLYNKTNELKLMHYSYVFLTYKSNKLVMEHILNFDFKDRYKKGVSDNPYSLMLGSVGDMCAQLDFLKYKAMPVYEV